jgi:ATP:corrinoid adenosyltransferase
MGGGGGAHPGGSRQHERCLLAVTGSEAAQHPFEQGLKAQPGVDF